MSSHNVGNPQLIDGNWKEAEQDEIKLEGELELSLDPQSASDKKEHIYSEGGLTAWLTVAGAFACMFCAYGWTNAIGVFQDYYKTHQLSQYSDSTISWIGSLNVCLMYFCGFVC